MTTIPSIDKTFGEEVARKIEKEMARRMLIRRVLLYRAAPALFLLSLQGDTRKKGFTAEGPVVPKVGIDTKEEEEIFVFRGMTENNTFGIPLTGESARKLGVRPGPVNPPHTSDIDVDLEGNVLPMSGGMSVAPVTPFNLPSHRRPPEFGGIGKDPVWKLNIKELPPGLLFVPDSPTHGTIQPATKMPYGVYKQLLESTKNLWKRERKTK